MPDEASLAPDPAPADPAPVRWLVVVRGVVFVTLVAFFGSGLVGKQLTKLGVRSPYLPAWIMFSGAGVGRSQVKYWTLSPDGEPHEVDPYKVLELERSKRTPAVFRIKGRVQAHQIGLRMCRELGPGTDLRMRVRTVTAEGWKVEARGKQNLCTTSPHKKKNRNKKKKEKRKSA